MVGGSGLPVHRRVINIFTASYKEGNSTLLRFLIFSVETSVADKSPTTGSEG